MDTGIVTSEKDKWQGHPDVALFSVAGLNYLFVVWRESEHHKTNTNTAIKISSALINKDKLFFSEPMLLFESGVNGRYNCPRLSVLDGKLYCTVDFVKNDKQDFVSTENKEDNTRICIACTSDGSNWKYKFDTGITGILPDRLIRFKGNYLLATHMARGSVIKKLDGRLVQDIWCNPSDDPFLGEWKKNSLAGSMELNLCEGSVFQIDENRLGCVMRENSQQGLPAYYSCSHNGLTWTKPKQTRLFGAHRPTMGKLKSGNYFVTYREQMSTFAARSWARNTFSSIIYPSLEGKPEFKQINILPLDHDNSTRPDGGYTGWVQLPDESIFIVNYITGDSKKPYIKWYNLSEKEFYDKSLEGDFF